MEYTNNANFGYKMKINESIREDVVTHDKIRQHMTVRDTTQIYMDRREIRLTLLHLLRRMQQRKTPGCK